MLTIEDNTIYMQLRISELLMWKWQKTPRKFIELDKKYRILEYIRNCYDSFISMGDDGIIEDIQQFIRQQGGILR